MTTPLRLVPVALVTALASVSLLAVSSPPALAAPVFTVIYSDADQGRGWSGGCTDLNPGWGVYPTVDLPENGAPVANNVTTSTKVQVTGDNTDVVANTATYQATSAATTAAGVPRSIVLGFGGAVSATSTKSTSGCAADATAGSTIHFEFALTAPMWATLSTATKGPASAAARISEDDTEQEQESYGRHLDGSGSTTVLLQPGSYRGTLEGEVGKETNTAYARTATGSASITFASPGSASAAPTGKAAKYVSLPGARSCAADNATATLTTKKKRVKQLSKVVFEVNGTKTATLKGKKLKKGRSVALPIADGVAADIVATVTLNNGKKRTVRAGYLACGS